MKFSISVPIGEYHPFLRSCLESLICQDADLAIAFMDASGDARVSQLADQYDASLACRRHGSDGGQSDAINEGWAKTDGDILGWLNADDHLFPGALETVAKIFAEKPDTDVVYGHSSILDEEGRITGYHWAVEPPGPRLLQAGIISQPSCFFRRSAVEAAGGLNNDLHYTMDWDLFIRMYRNGAKFKFVDDVLSAVLWGEDTKTSSFTKRRREELQRIIREHAPVDVQRKVFRSFAIQNMLDRLRPKALQKMALRSLARGRHIVYGLTSDGSISGAATLHLAHFDEAPKKGVRIAFQDAGAVARVTLDDADVEMQRFESEFEVLVGGGIPPSKTVRLQIETQPDRTARFIHCAWID